MSIATEIRRSSPGLSRAEQKVARTLLADYPAAGLQTVARFAAQAGVSAPTVLKVTERMGFAGYGDFQQALREELRSRHRSPLDQYDDDLDDHDLSARGRRAFMQCVTRTFDELDQHEFDRAIALLSAPRRRILTTGGRFSSVAARSLALHLEIVRPGVRFLGAEEHSSALVDIGPGDVVFVIDLRRYQPGTIRFARAAAARGARIVLLTDPWRSPVAANAEAVLTTALDTPSPFDSLVGANVVVETVVAAVIERLGTRPKTRMRAYDRAWREANPPDEWGPQADFPRGEDT